MTMTQEMRYKQLKAMDRTIRECVNDEGYFFHWIALGVPDGSDESDFRDFAEDEDDFNEFLGVFNRIVDRMDADKHEMSKQEITDKFISYL